MNQEEEITYHIEQEGAVKENLEPPFVIVVQGSKESGKTTLIKSLVYNFTRQKIHDVKGTITLRTNKNQRITFYECPTDMEAMMDLAKIADLALLLIDASIGFEMETFEFLCLLHNHGMPNVMGVLTHLDYFKLNKTLRKTKKLMKKRFWKEVYDGAKLFYLSGLQADGAYPKTEIHNLGRYITIQKFKPLSWRQNHSYLVADRFDVIETQDDQERNTVSFYGYIRGTYLDEHNKVHLNGVGDFDITKIEKIDDPCPAEERKTVKQKQKEFNNEQVKKKKRHLKDREKVIYAPYSNIGAMNFEKTTGFINIPDQYVVYTKLNEDGEQVGGVDTDKGNEGQKMVWGLQDMKKGIDDNEIEAPMLLEGVKLQSDGKDQQDKKWRQKRDEQLKVQEERVVLDKFEKQKHLDKQFLMKEKEVDNLQNLIYGDHAQEDTDIESDTIIDSYRYDSSKSKLEKYLQPEYKKLLKLKFVTGQSSEQVMKNLLDMSDSDDEDKNDKKLKKLSKELAKKKQGKGNKDSEEEKSEGENESSSEEENEELSKKNKKKQERQKIDPQLVKQQEEQKKQMQFMGETHGHYKLGTFVRVELKLEKQQSRQLTPDYPVILCSMRNQEQQFLFLRVKIKKHRWYPHILKNRDPLIFSVGWRKFQSIPTYTMDDEDGRQRMIKYTPKFGFCYAVFYGPAFPVNTSFIGVQKFQDESGKDLAHFRICVTGMVVEMGSNFKVMKKLKLIGEPLKVHKNTAFIKGMFNSKLEVAKFQGAQLRTVSGVRGSIKRAIKENAPEGSFRATFEDKILMSDIVFCRTWYQVDLPRFYNPIIQYGKTRLLKTHSELRRDRDLPIPTKGQNSEYLIHDEKVDRERDERIFAPLQVSKGLESKLPFKSKQKVKVFNDKVAQDKREQFNLLSSLNLPTKRPLKKMFMNEQEKKIYSMVQRLSHIGKEHEKERSEKREQHAQKVKKRLQKEQDKRDQKSKELRKTRYKKAQYKKGKQASDE